jgi:hypothetical protein
MSHFIKIMKFGTIFLSLIFALAGCSGFYKPVTMDLQVPDGPPEFQAGWHDGCSTGLAISGFQNARFVPITAGNGIYQHDPIYQMAHSKALSTCTAQPGFFISHQMFAFPLE